MKRLFAAINISPNETFMELFYKLKRQLKEEKIKWVDINNVHITLKFFGETAEDRIPDIIETLDRISEQNNAFAITIKNLGIFGSSYKPRVIWFGIEENRDLMELGHNVQKNVEEIGFIQDRQNFRPHLTIGRIKYIDNKKRFNALLEPFKNYLIQNSEVNKMDLYESILKPSGPEYSIIDSFPLK